MNTTEYQNRENTIREICQRKKKISFSRAVFALGNQVAEKGDDQSNILQSVDQAIDEIAFQNDYDFENQDFVSAFG